MLAAVLTQSAVSGANPLVELTLEAPPGCPAPAMVERAIERLVKHPPPAPLRISARLVPLPDHWQLRASFESGTRMVDGDSCTAVAEALVVMVALAIDPTGTLDESVVHELEREAPAAPTPTPTATAPVASAVPTVQAVQPAPRNTAAPTSLSAPQRQTRAAQAATPWRAMDDNAGVTRDSASEPPSDGAPPEPTEPAKVGVTGSLLAASGLLPEFSLGPSAAVHYGHRREWAEIAAMGLFPRFASVGNGSPIGGNITWFGAQAGGCALPFANLPLGGCLAAEFGDLLGRGERVRHPRTAHAFIPGVSAALILRSRIRADFGLEARLGLAVLGVRPKLGLEGYGFVFQPDPISWRAAIGFSWR